MRSIRRRDTGEGYRAMLTRMAEASGIATPTAAELKHFDQERKQALEQCRVGESDRSRGPDHAPAGRPHAARLQARARRRPRDRSDRRGRDPARRSRRHHHAWRHSGGRRPRAGRGRLRADERAPGRADRRQRLSQPRRAQGLGRRSLADPDRGPKPPDVQRWRGDLDARRAGNRARLRSGVGKEALALRAEKVERSFALILDRGGLRRAWLRGRENVQSAISSMSRATTSA